MFTEQEAVAQLNERISSQNIKQTTKRFLEKIKFLQRNIESYNEELKKLEKQKRDIEKEIDRTKGAISILLELSAEEEGMLESPTNNLTTS